MNTIYFLFGILVYIVICYGIFRIYIKFTLAVHDGNLLFFVKIGVQWVSFLVVSIGGVFFGIFFPAWLNHMTGNVLNSEGGEPIESLVFFGCIVMALAVFLAFSTNDGKRFVKVFNFRASDGRS